LCQYLARRGSLLWAALIAEKRSKLEVFKRIAGTERRVGSIPFIYSDYIECADGDWHWIFETAVAQYDVAMCESRHPTTSFTWKERKVLLEEPVICTAT
jgi:hypothetical protein